MPHPSVVTSVKFSPDGTSVITGANGILERGDGGVPSLLADNLEILDLKIAWPSRGFR